MYSSQPSISLYEEGVRIPDEDKVNSYAGLTSAHVLVNAIMMWNILLVSLFFQQQFDPGPETGALGTPARP